MFGLSTLQLRLVAGVLALSLLSGAFMWYGGKREAAGFASGGRAQLETDKVQFEQVSKQYQDALAKAQSTIDSSNARIVSLDGQLQTLKMQFGALAAQRQQGQETVNKLPDSAVQGDLETKLGGSLTDSVILRKNDQIVTDYPVVLKQVDVLSARVDTLDSKFQALSDKEQAVEKQRDAAIAFGDQVVGFYTKAYNAAQKKHSLFVKIISFGLVRDRHMDLPAPTSLVPHV